MSSGPAPDNLNWAQVPGTPLEAKRRHLLHGEPMFTKVCLRPGRLYMSVFWGALLGCLPTSGRSASLEQLICKVPGPCTRRGGQHVLHVQVQLLLQECNIIRYVLRI